ncbi:hypothetical protein ACFWG5_12085 [Streptomyces hydrogenans]|uniref:hypothetical protein n=1 Tax=Streptomyces TaxID=1883 RepID=UPI0036475C92
MSEQLAPSSTQELSREFPAVAEREYVEAQLSIPMAVDGEIKEILKLTSLISFDRDEPITNSAGYRQFQFVISEWEVGGFSELLNEWVTFTLSDCVQPQSVMMASTTEADFPASVIYSSIFDVYVGKRRVAEMVSGLGIGNDVTTVPPTNTVNWQKTFTLGGGVETMPGACTCMSASSTPSAEFTERMAQFRAVRS